MPNKNRLYQKFIFENVGKIGEHTVKFRLKNANKITIAIGCQSYTSIAQVKKAAAEALKEFNDDHAYSSKQLAAEKKAYAATIAKMQKLEKLFKKNAKVALR